MTDKAGLAWHGLPARENTAKMAVPLRVSRASIPINDIDTPQSRKGRLAADALRQSIDNLKRKLSGRL